MRQFLIRRVIQSALLLWVLMTFTFFLVRLTPGGPEAAFLESPNIERADIERIRERLGLNDPVPVAYGKWLLNVARLDFGRSYQYLRPPMALVAERIGPTAQLAAMAIAIGFLGIPLGVWAAVHRGKGPDLGIRFFTVLGDALPNWWLALVVVVVMANLVGWFPNGTGGGLAAGPVEWLKYLIVPATILGLGPMVVFTRFVRSQVIEVLGQDYVRTARAKGLVETAVTSRHVLRNALLPVVTLLGGLLPVVVSGFAITEGIFNWPGMGRLFLEAAFTRDYPVILCVLTLSTVLTLLGTLLADVAYGFVDPRIKYS